MKCYKCGGIGCYECDGTGECEPFDADVELDKLDDIKVPPFTEAQKMVIEATEKLAKKCDKISANVNKWGRKNICDVDDDIDEFPKIYAEPQPSKDFLPINCYVCNASGWIAGNGHRHTSKCKRCNGTGKINYYTLTNEDFLRTATTEQLAEILAMQKCDGCNDEPYDDKHGTCIYCMTKKKEQMVEWLKQKHTNE